MRAVADGENYMGRLRAKITILDSTSITCSAFWCFLISGCKHSTQLAVVWHRQAGR
nr:hypothetical protein Itr_chr09CG00200 [Ipomoea trifida]